jgi:hypothetical protein
MTFLDVVLFLCCLSPSVVTYRANDQSAPLAGAPANDPLSDGDSSKSSSLSNPIRTRTNFPETWLWQNLLVNGYHPYISIHHHHVVFFLFRWWTRKKRWKELTAFAKERMCAGRVFVCWCVIKLVSSFCYLFPAIFPKLKGEIFWKNVWNGRTKVAHFFNNWKKIKM